MAATGTTVQPATTQATMPATAASAPPTTPAPTVATTAPAKTWTAVTTLSGTAEKRGDNFRLSGGSTQTRLRYTSSAGVFAVYVTEAGDSLEESGGFPEVSCSLRVRTRRG